MLQLGHIVLPADVFSCIGHPRGRDGPPGSRKAGHADLSNTMRYVHLSPASLNQAIRLLEQPVAGVPRPSAVPARAITDLYDASPEARLRHAYGRAYRDLVRGFACDFSAAPDFVCLPRSEEDVARALEGCAAARIAVAPYGGGTSVVGGVEAGGRGRPACSLDLGRLSRVLKVDAVSRAARIQAGALGPDLEAVSIWSRSQEATECFRSVTRPSETTPASVAESPLALRRRWRGSRAPSRQP